MFISKSDMVAGTEVCARTMLPGPIACTVPPLKVCGELPLVFGVGVTTTVIVAVDPDCNEGTLQLTTALVDAPPQVPDVTLAETNVNGTMVIWELKLSVTVILVAKSGPVFVTI